MTLENKLRELRTYEKALKEYYPELTYYEIIQVAVSLMNCKTKEDVINYIKTL
jgi:hypothetical protein